jgi:DNA integrity scanning protein DisA with diadenylate cyclase activity
LLLDEISALDGAVVVGNHGRLLAYGAVLQPNKRDKFNPSEGSRTKAAITASKFGIAIKVSSDGDITFYEQGKPFLKL